MNVLAFLLLWSLVSRWCACSVGEIFSLGTQTAVLRSREWKIMFVQGEEPEFPHHSPWPLIFLLAQPLLSYFVRILRWVKLACRTCWSVSQWHSFSLQDLTMKVDFGCGLLVLWVLDTLVVSNFPSYLRIIRQRRNINPPNISQPHFSLWAVCPSCGYEGFGSEQNQRIFPLQAAFSLLQLCFLFYFIFAKI